MTDPIRSPRSPEDEPPIPEGWPIVDGKPFNPEVEWVPSPRSPQPPETPEREHYRLGVANGERYARRPGSKHLCCYVEESDHPTYPTYSDHEFGDHPFLAPKVGCRLCSENLNKGVRAARAVLDGPNR